MPSLDRIAYYAGIATLGAIGLIDWPIVAVIGAGHWLSAHSHDKALQQIGEALESA